MTTGEKSVVIRERVNHSWMGAGRCPWSSYRLVQSRRRMRAGWHSDAEAIGLWVRCPSFSNFSHMPAFCHAAVVVRDAPARNRTKMPHGNDKKKIAYLTDFLGGPIGNVAPHVVNGRSLIDPSTPGQRYFQALLFRLLNTPPESQPWLLKDRRSAKALTSYFYWVRPLPDRLEIVTNAPSRIAFYLLPFVKDYPDGSYEIIGIPGLRLADCGNDRVVLSHLPTGGVLELIDSMTTQRGYRSGRFDTCSRELFDLEFQDQRPDGWRGVYEQPVLTPTENEALDTIPAEPSLTGRLMSRINIWWYDNPDYLTVTAGARSRSHCQLQWEHGFTADEVGVLLTDSPLRIEGLRYEPAGGSGSAGLLQWGDDRVELAGPRPPGEDTVLGDRPLLGRALRDHLWRLRMLGSEEVAPRKDLTVALLE